MPVAIIFLLNFKRILEIFESFCIVAQPTPCVADIVIADHNFRRVGIEHF